MPNVRWTLIFAFCVLSGPALADDAGDTAEYDFYSQKPPDYDALERLQRSNVQAERGQGAPVAPVVSGRRRR